MIGISQLLYRIKGNSNLLEMIALISSAAIIALCFTFSFNQMLDQVVISGSPFSLMYESEDSNLHKQVEDVITKDGKNQITYQDDIPIFHAKGLTEHYYGAFDANSKEPFELYVIPYSSYQMIMEHSLLNQSSDINERAVDIKIPGENACFFIEVSNLGEGRGRLAGDEVEMMIDDETYTFHISDSDIKAVLGIRFQKSTMVVQDQTFKKLIKQFDGNLTHIRVYNFNNPAENEAMLTALANVIPQSVKKNSYYDSYIALHGMYGSFTFVGLFLGGLFVVSTGSILYYKLVIEANEDKERYLTLYKIGLSRHEMKKTIQKQIRVIFALPIVAAVINCVIAMIKWVAYTSNGAKTSMFQVQCIAVMMGSYVAIYFIFYLLSVRSYAKMTTSH